MRLLGLQLRHQFYLDYSIGIIPPTIVAVTVTAVCRQFSLYYNQDK